jgi:PleD family two-component response regulator
VFVLDRFGGSLLLLNNYFNGELVLRILVAEDDATSQELLKLNLESWGYQVTVCDDGKQALQAMSQLDTPRVAVLDWMMPELSGVDVCRQVRQFDHGRLIYFTYGKKSARRFVGSGSGRNCRCCIARDQSAVDDCTGQVGFVVDEVG